MGDKKDQTDAVDKGISDVLERTSQDEEGEEQKDPKLKAQEWRSLIRQLFQPQLSQYQTDGQRDRLRSECL